MLVAQPSFFVYRMVVEHPQTLSIVPEPLPHVLFYVESSHEQLYKKSLMEHGNGMVPAPILAQRFEHNWERDVGRYPSRVVTTTFAEVCMKLEFVAEEFSRDVDVFTTD